MFDLIPFMDEVHIVEIGRLCLCGGDPYTILMAPDGSPAMSIYYAGPCVQEFAFRLLGAAGPRITSLVGAFLSAFFFWTWLRKTSAFSRGIRLLLSLIALAAPVMFQCIIMGRADNLAIACAFAILALLGSPREERSALRLAAAGFLAALSVFIWPSSMMFAPLYPVFCFNLQRKREFAIFCLSGLLSLPILLIPVYPVMSIVLNTLSHHVDPNTVTPAAVAMGAATAIVKEIGRAPFLLLFAAIGFAVWIHQRRFMAALAFAASFILGCLTGLYTFRFVYLTPFLLLMIADAAASLECSAPRLNRILLGLTCVYGFLTGPIGHLLTPHEALPQNLKAELADSVGTGPIRVFSPDYATYYIGRELGWRQFAYARQGSCSDPDKLRSCLDKADAVVLYDWNPYQTIQESCTPYGYFSKYVLTAARCEKDSPSKSWPARFGSQYANPWRAPFVPAGFHEVKRIGPVLVYLRNRPL